MTSYEHLVATVVRGTEAVGPAGMLLVGLEILVIIADIIRTVPVSATSTNVADLGAVVLIRTVL